jgi:uncharacterized membrane protein
MALGALLAMLVLLVMCSSVVTRFVRWLVVFAEQVIHPRNTALMAAADLPDADTAGL